MSEENVEIVRRMYAAWNAGDMDAVRELHDADASVRPAEGWPEPGPFVGREAAVRWYAQLREAFDIDALEQISFTDAGDRVVLRFIWHGIGRGPEANQEFSGVFTVGRGRVVLVEFFLDHAEALEAAGLREQGDTAWAMSEENVEIVRQSLAATSGGDPEAAQAAFDPLIEWDMSGVRGWLEKSVYRGPEVLEFLRAWADSWQDWHFDVTDVRDAGKDRVFAAIHEWGIGAESRVDVEQRRYFVFTVRGGLLVRVQMFSESAEALEAAGLRE